MMSFAPCPAASRKRARTASRFARFSPRRQSIWTAAIFQRAIDLLEERLETGRAEMRVVREPTPQPEPPHNDKRNVIHDAGAAGVRAIIGGPRLFPIVLGRADQLAARVQFQAKLVNLLAIRASGCRVAAFKHHVSGRHQLRLFLAQLSKGRRSERMPLIRAVPKREQPNCIKKHGIHGWCSLWRAATSCSPESKRLSRTAYTSSSVTPSALPLLMSRGSNSTSHFSGS